jgi:hypothetical protein
VGYLEYTTSKPFFPDKDGEFVLLIMKFQNVVVDEHWFTET